MDPSQPFVMTLRSARSPGASPTRVLLALLDLEHRTRVAAMLRDERYEVVVCADGRELLARSSASVLEREAVHLIVADDAVLQHAGAQLARGMRRARWQVPVLLVGGHGAAGGVHRSVVVLGPLEVAELCVAASSIAPPIAQLPLPQPPREDDE